MAHINFYVGAIFIVVTLFPWTEVGSKGSPFVLTFASGIVSAAAVLLCGVNCGVIWFTIIGMYSGGRMLYALAQNKQLPKSLLKLTKNGVPARCVGFTILCLVAGSSLNSSYRIRKVFVYVYSASVLPGMVPWLVH